MDHCDATFSGFLNQERNIINKSIDLLLPFKICDDAPLVMLLWLDDQYEEDRLLGGGSRKVPGLRTRLELNWQKEREEQQRLLQETATLAKDLRQVMLKVYVASK